MNFFSAFIRDFLPVICLGHAKKKSCINSILDFSCTCINIIIYLIHFKLI